MWNNGGGVNHYGGYGPSLTVRSCTIVQDRGVGIYWAYSPVVLSNNIVVASGAGSRCLGYDQNGPGSVVSDYNDFYSDLERHPQRLASGPVCLAGGAGTGCHSFSLDPFFLDEWGGDFHLQTRGVAGTGGTWLADSADSSCIDAGDPARCAGRGAFPQWRTAESWRLWWHRSRLQRPRLGNWCLFSAPWAEKPGVALTAFLAGHRPRVGKQ